MATDLLLRSQRNEVFELVAASGLAPAEFSWDEWASEHDDDLTVSVLMHKPTEDYWFKFDRLKGLHYAIFAPGRDSQRQSEYPGAWPNQLAYVRGWLGNLKRELDAPDLWSAIVSTEPVAPRDNRSFSQVEVGLVHQRLDRIEAGIAEAKSLDAGEAAYVHESLDYLKESARTHGRRDWVNLAVGSLLGIVIFLGIPPEAAGGLFHFITQQLQGLGNLLPAGGLSPSAVPQPGPPPARRG